jgi:L-lactate dehydrogenase complex protein LldG
MGFFMENLLINRFIEMSSMVANKNYVISLKEIDLILEKENFDFISIPSKHIKRYCTIDEKGIARSFIEADAAIAETGTVIILSKDEKIRLATSLAEELNVLLYESKILSTLDDAENLLTIAMEENSNYVAFITGASRTADIERVLTIGVHGPVRMNVYIVRDGGTL